MAILPLFDDGTVSLVRQFRYPFQEVVAELPAGKLERGEDHRLAALRELEEEVGLLREADLPGVSLLLPRLFLGGASHVSRPRAD